MSTPAGTAGFASETIPVKEAHRFDEARLLAYLIEHVEGFAGPLTVQQFEGGQSNPTYFLTTPTRNYVLRRKPPGRLVKSAHAIEREYRVIRALNATDFPVPKAYVLCEDERVIGTAFFVMSHVPGHARSDVSMPDLTPDARARLVHSYVDTLAQLHRYDPAALGLADFGPPGNYFARQVSRWSRQFLETETEKIPEMHQLAAWLEGAIPEQARTTVVHGDYSFHNLLSHPSEPRIAAVLDWELSTIGDPLADFTYFTQPWFAPPGGERSFAGHDLGALGVPDYAALRDRYCERAGIAGIPQEGFYRAFHAFRSGAILQGIIKRRIDGTAAGAMAAQFTPEVVRAGAVRGLAYAASV
jgi:aminoglycoside phosphotransferase (APT) family kinase protein